MKLLVVLSLTAVAMILHQVQGKGSTESITSASNRFANKLYQQLSKKPGNILVCPVSLHVALALLHQGAGGNTAIELAKTLGLSGSNEEIKSSYLSVLNSIQGKTLKVATKLYPAVDLTLNQNYASDAKQYFLSGVEAVDYKNATNAANQINKFVEEATNNKIRDLVSSDSLSELTRLMIVNAVHFQASWKTSFPTSYEGNFKVNKQQKVKAQMMRQTKTFRYKMDRNLDAEVLTINYDVEGFSMLIVLPNKEEGLTEVEARLQSTSITSLMKGLFLEEVDVTIPKFTMEQTMDLNDILGQMGLTQVFGPKADLSTLAEGENLFVSKVVQKTFISVHEKGTEAGAATGITMGIKLDTKPKVFIADKPFHFKLLKSPENLVLFEGRLESP